MLFAFADCELNTDLHELRRDGVLQQIEPQVFDLITHLLENPERTVTKDELLSVVWRGRIVSEATLSSRVNAARRALGDDGEQQKLIKTVRRRGFRFVGPVTVREASSEANLSPVRGADEIPPLPDKPSIAVLPFENLSGDPEHAYFADGMAEEIITALSHVEWLFVIARNSSFSFRGQQLDAREIGRRLGVRYLLEGSVRRDKKRLRITAQLIEAETGTHLWAQRYEGNPEEVFELQDRITESVLGAVQPKLRAVEMVLSKRKRPDNLNAYDYLLRALPNIALHTRTSVEEAERFLHASLEIDPDYVEALGLASWCRAVRPNYGWSSAPEEDFQKALVLAQRALSAGPDSATALSYAAYSIVLAAQDYDTAIELTNQAVVVNRNSALAFHIRGWIFNWIGDGNQALEAFVESLRLSPSDPLTNVVEVGMSFAHNIEGRPEKGLHHARKSLRLNQEYVSCWRMLVGSLSMLGQFDEAREAVRGLLRIQPSFTVSGWTSASPFRGTPGQKRLIAAMVKGGLSE